MNVCLPLKPGPVRRETLRTCVSDEFHIGRGENPPLLGPGFAGDGPVKAWRPVVRGGRGPETTTVPISDWISDSWPSLVSHGLFEGFFPLLFQMVFQILPPGAV